MCGITGIYYRDKDRPAEEGVVRAMCDAIVHRGPDDQGQFVDANVGIGMRRLSIIDLAGGHQPMFNDDQSIAIVFNGEIFNCVELRKNWNRTATGFAHIVIPRSWSAATNNGETISPNASTVCSRLAFWIAGGGGS